MRTRFYHRICGIILLSFCLSFGCRKPAVNEPSQPPTAKKPSNQNSRPSQLSALGKTDAQKEELKKLEDLIAQGEQNTPPPPVLKLPTLEDWTVSQPRSLINKDDGFSISLDHKTLNDVAATLYQFTRGDKNIPNGANGRGVKREMDSAKGSLQEATNMGLWDSAEEVDSKVVRLGDSQQQAMWVRYKLRGNGTRLNSEIYVWAKHNHYFKIRLTTNPRLSDRRKKVISELLTAIGNAKRN